MHEKLCLAIINSFPSHTYPPLQTEKYCIIQCKYCTYKEKKFKRGFVKPINK